MARSMASTAVRRRPTKHARVDSHLRAAHIAFSQAVIQGVFFAHLENLQMHLRLCRLASCAHSAANAIARQSVGVLHGDV